MRPQTVITAGSSITRRYRLSSRRSRGQMISTFGFWYCLYVLSSVAYYCSLRAFFLNSFVLFFSYKSGTPRSRFNLVNAEYIITLLGQAFKSIGTVTVREIIHSPYTMGLSEEKQSISLVGTKYYGQQLLTKYYITRVYGMCINVTYSIRIRRRAYYYTWDVTFFIQQP